jgi:hypothetical protein
MNMKNKYILILFCTLIPLQSFSWNALGHRLITQIAYDHLTRQSKITFNAYNRAVEHDGRLQSLVNASTWLDSIRSRTHAYDAMHYIDIPFTNDGSRLPITPRINAVSAVQRSEKILRNRKSSARAKGIALRILMHAVGDLHQPLHAATRVSWKYPEGDKGGNLVVLHKNTVARNLHAYWDRGAGLLVGKHRYGAAWVKRTAAHMEQRWPCDMAHMDSHPEHWAQESHVLAVKVAYTVPVSGIVDAQYQQAAWQIIEPRLVLAGCRLAYLMNQRLVH